MFMKLYNIYISTASRDTHTLHTSCVIAACLFSMIYTIGIANFIVFYSLFML